MMGTIGPLEQFTLAAQSASGDGCANVVYQAIDAPGVYVFSELLELPSVQAVGLFHVLRKGDFQFGSHTVLFVSKAGVVSHLIVQKKMGEAPDHNVALCSRVYGTVSVTSPCFSISI